MSKNEQPEVEITEFDKLELFVTKHYKSVILGVVAVIGLVSVGVIVTSMKQDADKVSIAAITKAKTADELVEVIKSEAGHRTVVTAQIKLAKLYVAEKNYDKASEVYTAILASGSEAVITNRIKLNLAALLEVQGKADEAIARYKALGLDVTLGDDVRAEAKYSVARLLVAQDKKSDALVFLKELAAGTTEEWKAQADQMLKRL